MNKLFPLVTVWLFKIANISFQVFPMLFSAFDPNVLIPVVPESFKILVTLPCAKNLQ